MVDPEDMKRANRQWKMKKLGIPRPDPARAS